jgi:uncharacterized repeat protein (TIGR01451 family)
VIKQLGELTWFLRTGMRVILPLIFWLISSWLVAAQSAENGPKLDLSTNATNDVAVAGDTLTYLLVLTNTGPIPLEEVVVSDETPAGTTLFGVNSPSGWMMTTPGQGRTGQVVWQTVEPLPPGAEVTLEFIVTIDSDATGPIINDTYLAQVEGWSETVTGPPIVTELVSPTPTWTPPLVPTEIPTKTPTGAPTELLPEIPATAPAATATSSPPDVALEQTQFATPIPGTPAEDRSGDTGIGTFALTVFGVVVIVIGLMYLIGRWTKR